MWILLFVATTVICGIGWLNRYIACTAIIYYITEKGYRPPNEEEIETCTRFVIKHLFK